MCSRQLCVFIHEQASRYLLATCLTLLCFLSMGGSQVLSAPPTITSTKPRYLQQQPTTNTDQIIKLVSGWFSNDLNGAHSVAWGDVDGDGDLDLAVGGPSSSIKVYLNQEGSLQATPAWISLDNSRTDSVAWGDVDSDGDLDLAAGGYFDANKVYLNQEGSLQTTPVWTSTGNGGASSIAWGDIDGDKDLDLAVGDSAGPTRIYLNQQGGLQTTPVWISADTERTHTIAWGDVDGDGDLDLAAGGIWNATRVYLNQQGSLQEIPSWTSRDNEDISSIAWGDFDGDGDLDLAIGSLTSPNKVYLNQQGSLQASPIWIAEDSDYYTFSIAWGDVDGDGDLDLAAGNSFGPNKIYLNQKGSLQTIPAWVSTDHDDTNSVAWGDVDGDGDLDLAVGSDRPTKIYLNQQSGLQTTPAWAVADGAYAERIAWGDMDGDGDLDLATSGGGDATKIYLNQKGILQATPAWVSEDSGWTIDIAWGDVDGDGDLDLAIGGTSTKLYLNQQGSLQKTPAWVSVDDGGTDTVAWGDVDEDGDLDLAIGNSDYYDSGCGCSIGVPIQLYRNDSGVLTSSAIWLSNETDVVSSIAWGDIDGDGDLDLAAGGASTRLYLNQQGSLQRTSAWTVADNDLTDNIAWGDVDGDGDLDLAVASPISPKKIYMNQKGSLQTTPSWTSADNDQTFSVAWGDVDGDGDLDLVAATALSPYKVYLNQQGNLQSAPVGDSTIICCGATSIAWGDVDGDGDLDLAVGYPPRIYLNVRPVQPLIRYQSNYQFAIATQLMSEAVPTFGGRSSSALANADFYAVAAIRQSGIIPITYNLFHPASEPIREVRAYYTVDGSLPSSRSNWLVAQPILSTQTTDLTSSMYPTHTVTNTHVFNWDVFGSGFFGQSDNVVVRLEALPNLKPIRNGVPGPFQRPVVSAQTFPFRVRGNQIRVVMAANPTEPAAGAVVCRIPAQQTSDATPYVDLRTDPYRTDAQGYLQGRGNLSAGDRLIALWPISTTGKYTVYQTSATVTTAGLDAFTVNQLGVQTLTVSPDNPLLLFDLTVSLEWDARNDPTFLTQLENDLQRTSQILYDLTNGQATLGKVRIYHDKDFWGEADIVIQANNSQRPSAIMGGSVLTATADVAVNGQPLPDAYIPGQVRMGPTWNRFGNPNGTLGEDWPRALAHELGHYLFFQADNYIGVTTEGKLKLVDCAGSDMTDPYEEGDSEFLTRAEWTGDCLNTVANHYLGRADWETITRFYPMLNGTHINPGPSQLPLAVTQIETVAPPTPTTTLAAPFFHLVDDANNTLAVPEGRGQAYLFKTRGNNDPTDDYIIAEGTPIGDLVQARGAAPGDRLCAFDYSHTPVRLGCNVVGTAPAPVILHQISGWAPQIRVTGVSTNTVSVVVTNLAETNLAVQLLPALGAASSEVVMARNGDSFVQQVTAVDGAFYGYVRIWVPNSHPRKEMITEYTVVEAWNGRAYAWGGRAYAWGGRAYAWGAPIMSGDGQVSIFPLDNLFSSGVDYTLQTVTFPPRLPAWLTPVGQAYQVTSNGSIASSAILFTYLARDVPDGYEGSLSIYYSPDEGGTWQRLATDLDTRGNHASASIQGEGVYLLASTVAVKSFTQGWNTFGYSVQTPAPVANALASIAGSYGAVYHFESNVTPQWQLFDPNVPPPFDNLANNLTQLEYNGAYWLYATQPVTLYLNVGGADGIVAASNTDSVSDFPLAPATYYGWIIPAEGFDPTEGMRVTAAVDGVVCGKTTVQELAGKLAYILHVAAFSASSAANACGLPGKAVVFRVGDKVMSSTATWDNRQAWFYVLSTKIVNSVYLPNISR